MRKRRYRSKQIVPSLVFLPGSGGCHASYEATQCACEPKSQVDYGTIREKDEGWNRVVRSTKKIWSRRTVVSCAAGQFQSHSHSHSHSQCKLRGARQKQTRQDGRRESLASNNYNIQFDEHELQQQKRRDRGVSVCDRYPPESSEDTFEFIELGDLDLASDSDLVAI